MYLGNTKLWAAGAAIAVALGAWLYQENDVDRSQTYRVGGGEISGAVATAPAGASGQKTGASEGAPR